MKQKGFVPIIILILIALAVVGYFGYKNYWPKIQTIVVPSPTPLATPDVTANWKTYTGSFAKNQYSFKYPENLNTLVTENGLISFFDNQTYLSSCEKIFKGQQERSLQNDPCAMALFNISLTIYSKQEFDKSGINIKSGTGSSPLDPKTYTDTQGRAWQTDMVLGESFNFIGIAETNGNIYIVGIQSGFGKNWEVNGGQDFRNLANQILSTFKFTESTISASPTPAQKACTLEAKVCPDGSSVGRTGPNCEFAPCP